MKAELSHERLEVYRQYLTFAGYCGEIITSASDRLVALEHLDRAMESIGVNLMHANAQPLGASLRAAYLDVAIASTHECAAALEVCLAREVVTAATFRDGVGQLWRIRGMLLGLKRASVQGVQEMQAAYEVLRFPFAGLAMYQVALDGIRWIHGLIQDLGGKVRAGRKLDVSTTGTVLNIAEGSGRITPPDQERFLHTAREHACQTLVVLDLLVARQETTAARIADGKALQARVIAMLYAWQAKRG
jgi:four helix bundle protein